MDCKQDSLVVNLWRIADALEAMLERIPSPPRAREELPPGGEAGQPAHEKYLSGQWKRRDGHGVQKSVTLSEHTVGSPPVGTQLDPWILRDVPAIDGDENRAWPPITFNP